MGVNACSGECNYPIDTGLRDENDAEPMPALVECQLKRHEASLSHGL
jgi:hypothetical protein